MVTQEIFGRAKVLLPVIHVTNEEQALRNVAIAIDAGADGIFLINHDIRSQQLIGVHSVVRDAFPSLWVGINFLDLDTECAAQAVKELDVQALWTDDATSREILLPGWKGLYFGGVAFKYQPEVTDLVAVSQEAMNLMDVITTSGTGTGSAPDVDKIQTIRRAIGEYPMAIASGITPENIDTFLPLCDYFLVATGISFSHTELDPARVALLAAKIHAF